MQVHNLEAGLHKLMTTVFRSRGLGASTAEAKAAQHLSGATKAFNDKCKEVVRDKMRRGGVNDSIAHARREVVKWAHRL